MFLHIHIIYILATQMLLPARNSPGTGVRSNAMATWWRLGWEWLKLATENFPIWNRVNREVNIQKFLIWGVVGFDRFCLKNKKQLNLFLKAIAHDSALPKFGLRHSRQSSDQKRILSEDPMIQLWGETLVTWDPQFKTALVTGWA